jgi:peptide/nickel transport system permease protein
MLRYIIRRVLWGILMLILVCAATFVLFQVLPTVNPAVLRAGRNASPKIIHHIEVEFGLNQPLWVQFWRYLKHIFLHFNFGYSLYSGQSVLSLIENRLPATISLTVGAVVLWVVIGIPVGIISAIKRGTFLDRAAMGTALALLSAPVFWLALIAIYLFADELGRWPILPGPDSYVGLTADPWMWFKSLIMPWLVLSATQAAIYSRLLRGNLLEVMGEDYIRTARAKGLPERKVIWRHGVRAAITPVFTVLGLDIGALLGGAVLTETVFEIHGIGLLNFDAISHSDFPIVQGTTLLAAMFIIVANIVVDIGYAYLDPRVRYS